ncbi:MAG: glycosyltransferase family 39 protein [Candidatus Chisholmbacteria bacterium]|nr:glycosyltransferase family 39 protein [Candidatus Chisholmbacteria bacterium]
MTSKIGKKINFRGLTPMVFARALARSLFCLEFTSGLTTRVFFQARIHWWQKIESLILLVAVVIWLRLPTLFEPAWYGDENIYLTIGQGIRKGLVLYKDITDFPNKPPLIYLLAAAAKNVFWFRLLLMVWQVVGVIWWFLLVRELLPKRWWAWWVSTLIFVGLTATPVWEGTIANAEIFMMMPVMAGMWLLVRGFRKKGAWVHFLGAGVLFGLGFLFKIPVVAEIVAAVVAFWILRKEKVAGMVRAFTDMRLYIFGAAVLLPIALMLLFHWSQGVAPQELLFNATGSTGYVSVWQRQEGLAAWLTLATLPARAVALSGVLLVLLLLRKRLRFAVILTVTWFSLAMFGALVSGRPYPHYLLQVVPAFSLLAALMVGWRMRLAEWLVVLGILLLFVSAHNRFGFGHGNVVGYYHNFWRYISGQVDQGTFYNSFDGRMGRNYAVAKYLRERTRPDERIYVWGTEPDIYVLADRLPVGRLTTSFHVEDLNEYERLAEELSMVLPKYVVLMENEPRPFPQLDRLVQARYMPVEELSQHTSFALPVILRSEMTKDL